MQAESEWIELDVLKAEQPIGKFYVGCMPAQKLVAICRTDVRRFEGFESIPESSEADEGNVVKYIGIQRHLNPGRVKEIQQYVNTSDACFPNTIIIAIKSKDVEILQDQDGDEQRHTRLKIRNGSDVANVIDGQHRLAGFDDESNSSKFDLLATIFVDLEVAEQAFLFSTINTKQTRINPSLSQDLLDFSEIGTPEKVAHNIAKFLNSNKESPWYQLIKMLGLKDEITSGIITQHTFVVEILNLIYPSEYQIRVRDILKRKNERERLKPLDVDSSKYVFWDLYVTGQDQQIQRFLFNYFQAVKEVFPNEWGNREYILSKSVGYKALMLAYPKLFKEGVARGTLTKEFFLEPILQAKQRLLASGKELTGRDFASSASGASDLKRTLFG